MEIQRTRYIPRNFLTHRQFTALNFVFALPGPTQPIGDILARPIKIIIHPNDNAGESYPTTTDRMEQGLSKLGERLHDLPLRASFPRSANRRYGRTQGISPIRTTLETPLQFLGSKQTATPDGFCQSVITSDPGVAASKIITQIHNAQPSLIQNLRIMTLPPPFHKTGLPCCVKGRTVALIYAPSLPCRLPLWFAPRLVREGMNERRL
jgi:hypothetical protein